MILIMLLGITLFIAVTDMSKTWLDTETENILYYDTAVSDDSENDEDAAVSESVSSKNTKSAKADSVENKSDSNSKSSSNPDSLEEQLLNELNNAMVDSTGGKSDADDLDLDSLDFDADEVTFNTQPHSDEEIERDVETILNSFKDLTL